MALNRAWAGGRFDPRCFHAANVLLYALCSVLVFRLLNALLAAPAGRRALLSALAAALFLVLPAHMESVCNVKHREELMACLFGAAAWLAALHAERVAGLRRLAWQLAFAALFLAALLSKESAILLFPCMLLWAALRPDREPAPSKRLVPCFAYAGIATVAAYLILRAHALGTVLTPPGTWTFFQPDDSWIERGLVTAGIFCRHYLWDQLVTLQANPAFSSRFVLMRDPQPQLSSVLAAIFLMAALGLALRRLWRTHSPAAYWIVFAFITSAFAANLLPLGFAGAFRLMFTPSLGLCVLVVLALDGTAAWLGRRFAPLAAARTALTALPAAGLIAWYGWTTWSRLDVWRNDGTIYGYASNLEPGNPLSAKAAAEYFGKTGQTDLRRAYYERSLAAFLRHLGMDRLFDERATDALSVVATEVAYDEVRRHPERAIQLADLAVGQFRRLQRMRGGRLDTNVTAPYYAKALALETLGRPSESVATCREGLALAHRAGLAQLLDRLTRSGPPAGE